MTAQVGQVTSVSYPNGSADEKWGNAFGDSNLWDGHVEKLSAATPPTQGT
jgi:hypothetical protein